MKSVKFFLICWLCIHVCLLFPLQSQAEEQNVPEQNINEVDVQEENKEVQEQPEQVEIKQDKEEQQEVKNEQETEKKIETDQGIITINKRELKVGEEIRIIVEPKETNIQSIKGMLRLPKNSNLYEQERMIPFDYEEETKRWIANYKVGIFDLQGDWNLQLIQSFKENEKEELIENEVKVPLIRINNETPTIDKEMPKLHKVTIDEAKENVIERKRGDSIRVRVKAADVESVVKEVRVTLKGKENKEITFLLDYNKRDMEWQKVFEITDALPNGTYELLVEVVDAAGNKLVEESEYVVSVLEQKTEEDKKTEEREKEDKLENKLEDKKETEKQEDTKVEIPLQEEKQPVVQIPKKEEKVNDLIKEPLKEKEKITYVIKEPLTDNKEVNNTKAQKDKDNNNQVILKKKEKKEEPEDKKETKSDHGIQASNVFAIMSGLFVLFLVLKSNKEWG
ncbi:transglycosylase [Bacillus cereus group sp. TH43LC]|uniref:transglycosylase n=1 Tax=Bacillus TaxID=1386 RepID=UPI00148F4156|nr:MULTISPECIES: transglycosylase [Bacillus cereus group]MBE7142361.1 transglycosylase [Bacillus paranthracis]MDA1502650.1 transglycosylase [Bacillus cereus group sp. TH43LC]MDA1510168.1 transglycosylase [Bacillus cereus group sp. TH36-2LC]MDA1789647.1 transglycosylase [Bacillus cereus group sp. BY5-1LC]MDA1864574.1 transglycosylase [Bacillus cereus group sp. BY128LC]